MQEIQAILAGEPAPDESESTVETPEPVETSPEPEAPATTAEQPPEPPVERPRDEQGRWVKTEDRPQVPVSALIEERRKRQELEARLAALSQPKPEVTDEQFWQAPAQTAKQLVGEHGHALQQQILNIKYELAEDMTRTLHPDYDAVREQFIAKVNEGDAWAVAIAQQMSAKPNPAKFVYDQSKKLQALTELEQAGDLNSLRERIRQEERARLLAEMQKPAPPPAVPRSLNSEPSAPIPSAPDSFEPTPLGALFERQF